MDKMNLRPGSIQAIVSKNEGIPPEIKLSDFLCATTLWTAHEPDVTTVQDAISYFEFISRNTGDCSLCNHFDSCPMARLNE